MIRTIKVEITLVVAADDAAAEVNDAVTQAADLAAREFAQRALDTDRVDSIREVRVVNGVATPGEPTVWAEMRVSRTGF